MKKLSDLQGLNIVVYDTEIKNVIGQNDVTWDTHDKMGISVACLYDYRDGDTKVYLDDNLPALAERLAEADLVVGFNTIHFDHKLVRGVLGISLEKAIAKRDYDLLVELREGRGFNKYVRGCKLDEVLEATFGMNKTANGAEAPVMYQEKQMGKLISYCLADVRRERIVFEYAYIHEELKTPLHGVHPMRNPLDYLIPTEPTDAPA